MIKSRWWSNQDNREILLKLENISKVYPRSESAGSYKVLEDVSLSVRDGEIVAILGRSGSGKSTILRISAGLLAPSKGLVQSSGVPVNGPNPDVAMVFQSFALLPWLTVVENVSIGLDSLNLPQEEVRSRVQAAVKIVGLEGFERAYPRELSGGMQQRVGFARAFVMRPKVLLLDEPFSALDVLTAENLRGEIADMWESGEFPAQSVFIVTHNIEEAVLLADRVIVMGTNPGHIRGEIRISLFRPRDRSAPEFRAMCDHVYTIMTNPETKVTPLGLALFQPEKELAMLPHARAGAISGLLELIEEYGGPEDVAVISEKLRLSADDLLPILDAAALLGFADVRQGDASVTEIGKAFTRAGVDESRSIFRRQLLERAPLVQLIHRTLKTKEAGRMKADFFLSILDENYSQEEAQRQFETSVEWGRYAGLFEYDSDEETLTLHHENAEQD